MVLTGPEDPTSLTLTCLARQGELIAGVVLV